MLRPAQRRGLAGEAADRIRDAIFAGTFPPGAALKEVELAHQLGVSRGSVREGLAILEREGLIVTEWHKGTWVRSLTGQDVEELYTLRAALEGLAMRTAAGKDTARLSEIVDAMAGAKKEELVALDMRFHDAVYEAAGHTRLAEAWSGIRNQIHLFLLTRIQGDDDYGDVIAPEHAQLVEALRTGDGERAARLAEDQLRVAYEKLHRSRR